MKKTTVSNSFKASIILCVLVVFLVHATTPKGFFADEFQYFQSYGPALWNGNFMRLPMTPLVFNALQQNFLAYYFVQWAIAITGVFAVAHWFLGELRAWLSVLLVGTWYDFAFYSAKVLPTILLCGALAWFVFFLAKLARQQSSIWRLNELEAFSAFTVFSTGLLTKVSFAAAAPLAALASLKPRNAKWVLGLFSFGWMAVFFVLGLSTGQMGIDRYLLPGVCLMFPFLLAWVDEDDKAAKLFTLFILAMNLFIFHNAFAWDSSKFLQFERAGENVEFFGSVACDMPDYCRYYFDNCTVVELDYEGFERGEVQDVDFLIIHNLNYYTVGKAKKARQTVHKSSQYSLVYEDMGLWVYSKTGGA